MLSRRNKPAGIAAGAVGAVLLVAGAGYANYRSAQDQLRSKVEAMTGGHVESGRRAFSAYGCGSCHSISGIGEASGLVGPPLTGIGSRAIIGGKLENKPDNLQRWIMDPQAVTPGTAMPRLGVEPQEARDISAFLYMQS
ncbi:MAG TPA: c-type cytochrome [Allosphingosinicella sp.]|jgi:cytochrome c2|nr:c-type cytochrome [Allosphingosinicella sp.]